MGKKTPLFGIHKTYKAHMIEFAGWEMPLYYSGIIDEHKIVRRNVGLFDISHMGKIEIKGKDAQHNLQRLLVSDIQNLSISQVKYSVLCYSEGGIVDDITVYRLAEDRFLLCVNAINTEKDYQWIAHRIEGEAEVIDRSVAYAQIALQGPRSMEVLQNLTSACLKLLKNYWFVEGTVDGVPAIISRTGYTGEDGFELYFSPDFAIQIWERLMKEGKNTGIQPVGLGARDTLRLEMGFPLYGHELNETTTPLEARLKRFVDFRNPIFIGRESFIRQMTEGIQRRLVGFKMLGEGIPRAHYEIFKNSRKIGEVTSGTMSPILREGIGLGYVRIEEAWEGNEISIMIRKKMFSAEIVRVPIYKKSLNPIYQIGKGGYHGIALQDNCAH